MKEDRNTSQSVEEFGIKQATLVGYIQKDVGDLPTTPRKAYYLGLLEMEEKSLELCRFRLSKSNQLQLKL